jgi:hypothetical protein
LPKPRSGISTPLRSTTAVCPVKDYESSTRGHPS